MANIAQFAQRGEFQAIFLMGIRSISLVSKFALTLFIARFMGFEELGLYGLIVAGTFLIPSYTGLGIMHMKVRDAVTQKTNQIASTLEHYFKFLGLLYLALIPIALVAGIYTGNVVLSLVIIVAILFEHINNDLYNLLLNRSKPFTANILHFLRTTLWMITFMVVAYFYPPFLQIEVLLTGWIIGGVLALFGFFLVTRDWYKQDPIKSQPLFSWLKSEFKKSRTMYFNNVVDCSGQYLNHFLVTFFLGLELTGVYVYFMQIIGAMSNLLRTGVIQNFRPKLVTAYKEKADNFIDIQRRCIKQTMMFAMLITVVAVPVMYFLTLHVVDKPLAIDWFPIFGINLLFFCVMMAFESNQLTLYSHHRDDLILRVSLLNITGLIILNLIFIPIFGLWGVAFVLLGMSITNFMVQRFFIRKYISLPTAQYVGENKYIFYRNDQQQEHFEFDPKDEHCLDEVGYKYFGRVLHDLEPQIKDKGLIIYVTAWTVHELPSYGDNVVACILQDEWSRDPAYLNKVKMVFKTCGTSPVVPQVFQYGGSFEKIMNVTSQTIHSLRGLRTRLKKYILKMSGQKIAPIYNIPLGYYCREDVDYVPISQRTHDVYFGGSVTHMNQSIKILRRPKEIARDRMMSALEELSDTDINVAKTVTSGFEESIVNNNLAYLQKTMDSKICLIPRGANLETFRFYEAIQYGCIPVGEAFPKGYFYDDAPIVRLQNWADLQSELHDILRDTEKVETMHQRVLNWWQEKCSEKATARFMLQKINLN